jgi:hypothetical protein
MLQGVLSPRLLVSWSLAVVVLLPACTASPEVAVQVLTDLTPVTQFDEIVVVRDGMTRSHVVSNRERYDAPRAILEYRDLAPGTVLELAAELRLRGETVLRRTRRTTVQGSQIVLFTFTASCREIRCPMGDPAATECLAGRCVVPGCNGASCVVPECTEHDDCTARSSCESPRCVDGVCFQFADPSLCAQTEVCVAAMGCQPRLPDPDGGALDAAVALDAGLDAASALADGGVDASGGGGSDAGGADAATDAGRDAGPADAGRDAGATDAGRDAGAADSGLGVIVNCDVALPGTVCRPSRGPCDPAEVCEARGCPRDTLASAGTICRDPRGPCDVAESCDGLSAACPRDALAPDGTRCDVYCGPESCRGGVCGGSTFECAPGTYCCSDSTCSPLRCD